MTRIGRRARLIQPLRPAPRSGSRGLRGGSFRALPRAAGPDESGGVPVAGALGVESLGIRAFQALGAGSLVPVASELNRSVCILQKFGPRLILSQEETEPFSLVWNGNERRGRNQPGSG